jgi:hypothetical protein
MYLRTIARRNKDGSEVRYLQLAYNEWDPERRYARARVVHSFGREDQLDRAALARLVRSISRFLEPGEALAAAPGELAFLRSRRLGGAVALDGLWRALGIAAVLHRLLGGRRFATEIERVIFALVANRALAPSSKLAATEWVAGEVALPGLEGMEADHCYRAMDFLLAAAAEIEREVFFAAANLLNLEVDLVFFDTTSTYFETEDEDELRRYGHSKDHRPHRPQAVVGLAVTREGIPVRCWSFPGNASDQSIIRQVKDELREWRLGRVVWVGDRGLASEENRRYLQRGGDHYILGEKLRQGTANAEALARPGRYQKVADNLEVKEVWVGEGTGRRRFVVCRNPTEAERDRIAREKALARLGLELAALGEKDGEARLRAEGELLAHRTMGRYLARRRARLVLERAKVRAEARLDGKYLLSCSDDSLQAADMAIAYKQLQEVERAWRDLKQVIELRPIYHRKDERIRAHVLLCWLALLLVRVAETRAGDTWPTLRRELDRMHLGEFAGSAGRVLQRTETTSRQREILRALGLKEPPRFQEIAAQDAATSAA